GGVEPVAQPGDQGLAIPVGADAVELLADPPAGEVLRVVPALGQEQRRAAPGVLALGGGRGLGGEDLADPGYLGLVAAQPPEVLARPPLDGDRLVPPRRTGAGVDPADVLQDIRP